MKAPPQLEMSFTNFGAGVQALRFGADESLAVTAGGALRILDLRNFSDAGRAFIPANREAPTITCIAHTPDGKWIAQREDGTALSLSSSGNVAQSPVRRAALRFAAISSDGRRVAEADAEQPRKLFLGPTDDPANSVTVAPFTEEWPHSRSRPLVNWRSQQRTVRFFSLQTTAQRNPCAPRRK